MDRLSTVYEVLHLLEGFQRYLWIGGLVLALLNCFFGYRLRKLWGVLFGLLLGAGGGLALAIHQQYSGKLAVCLALGLSFLCALLAFLLYRLGLFFLCGGLTGFFLWKLLPFHDQTTLIICILVGCCAGAFALVKERFTVSLATALGGAWASAWFFCQLWGIHHPLILVLVTLLLAALGILVQLKPWRDRDLWRSENEREREKERLRRKRRKERGDQRRRRKKERRRAQKNKSKKTKKGQKGNKKQSKRGKTPRTSHRKDFNVNDRQAPNSLSRPASAEASAQTATPASSSPVSTARPAAPSSSPVSTARPAAASSSSSQASSDSPSGLPDLTDIRDQLSQEVSAIYQEKHSSEP